MKAGKIIQGRSISPADTGLIRSLLGENPDWNRSRLSRELCQRWDWRNGEGVLKDMAARTLLLKLERLGEIRLPARVSPGRPNRSGLAIPKEMVHETNAIREDLGRLRPLRIDRLGAGDERLDLFKYLLHSYHYLGHQRCVGENLKLMVSDRSGRLLACMLFGSAAWKVKSRDAFIGWDRQVREHNLAQLTNNTRFLILPWVQVPHLASHLLSRICRDLSAHWLDAYGHGIELIETFVDRERFRGTCYRAAGWLHVGATTGRSRNDVNQTLSVPIKDVFLYPLQRDFRRRLCV